MGKSKLKSALDAYKGRDIRLEKQRKKEKEARKRKEQRQQKDGSGDEGEGEGGVWLEQQVQDGLNGAKKGKKEKKDTKTEKKAEKPAEVEEGWETDDSEEDEDESDDGEEPMFDMSRLEDSDSEGSSDDDAENDDEDDEGEDEEEEDIALSDLESLASEDKGDIIPHQRLTINNTSALLAALHRIELPYKKMAFSDHMSVTTDEVVEIPDVEDDLNRELAFYKQSLSAVKDAHAMLKKEGIPFSRPADYFAEMVKSDEHMGKIKAKLIDEAAGKKAAAEARKQRDLKKFGKQVQHAKLQERAKDKRETMEKINVMKRKRQGADLTNTNEEDLFDVALDEAAKGGKEDRDGKRNFKRQKKDSKYGFGGKKRHAKSNDSKSTADMSGFSARKMKEGKMGKGGAKTGAAKRPGKARRAKAF
ncbi:Ebp2-domain-containing protein [Delitschia confertaspora ATCC 74209]|uniref:Ebp2-domain-containing protein n=1 Tax=Delitschia confertaspora ATCC 74209 TaxID=1513339 RepID=A0A9P4JGH6_9PLEO|nr:Ebp2-domain-containing protein [Delitschia confertaspora ATCC 74209]